jgi:hypothetical protein
MNPSPRIVPWFVTLTLLCSRVCPAVTLGDAVDAPSLTWNTSGAALWAGETTVTHDAVDAAQSGTITDSQYTDLTTTVTNGPGAVTFWWRVSSEELYDALAFYINNELQDFISGTNGGWEQRSFAYGDGTQTLRWTFTDDVSFTFGSNAGWLDQVSFGEGTLPGVAMSPTNQTAAAASDVTLYVSGNGTPTLGYQWRFNGVPLAGETDTALPLTNVQTANAGSYTCVVTNALGAATSQVATLTVTPTPPIVTLQPQSPGVIFGGNTAFATTARGTEPFSFQWQLFGTNLPGATGASLALSNVQEFNAGPYHARVTNSAGNTNSADGLLALVSLLAWGNNIEGETNIPASATNVMGIASGGTFNLARRLDGAVVAWGTNDLGQTTVPAGATNIAALAGGYQHCVAARSNGTVIAWGDNSSGQTNVPAAATNVIAVAAGVSHSLALRSNGTLVAWGATLNGQSNILALITNVIAISAGDNHNLALRSNGTVVAWGQNLFGQTNVPAAAASGGVAVAAGGSHSLALKTNGTVVAWGFNFYGQTNVPPSATSVMAIAAGLYHSLALRSNGTLVAWGYNGYGQTNVPAIATNVLQIAAAGNQNLVLIARPLQLDVPQLSASGAALRVLGPIGRGPVRIEASSNLTAWQGILTNPPVTGVLRITDSNAVSRPMRFYRASETR